MGGCLVATAAPPSQSSKPRDSCGTIVAFARQATTVRPGSGPDKLAAAVPDYGRRGRSPVSLEGPQRARRALSTVRCAVHCERPGAETSSSIVVHRNRSRTASSRTVPVCRPLRGIGHPSVDLTPRSAWPAMDPRITSKVMRVGVSRLTALTSAVSAAVN